MNAIEVSHLSKAYPGFHLDDVSFTLPEGMILGLVGENCAGKSTTIRAIMNARRPDAGEIRVLGCDSSSSAFCRVKEEIGVVLDEAYFPEVLTARNVGTVLARTYRQWDRTAYQGWLERFGLPEKTQFRHYSRGMRMKLALAAALSHRPRLLILDEATSGLDPMVREELLDIFLDFAREEDHAILISSHIISDLEKICDMVALMHGGRMVLCQDKDALVESYGKAQLTPEAAQALLPEAVLSARTTPYGVETLVRRELAPAGFRLERPTLEEILMAKTREVQHQ